MSTATAPARRTDALRLLFAGRAVAAAGLAAAVTFSGQHSPAFGLLAFGAFQVAQGALVALAGRTVPTRVGRLVLLARGAGGVLLGLPALVVRDGGLDLLLPLSIVAFLALGALEVIGGLRRADFLPHSREAVAVGGLTAIVGAMLLLLPHDAAFTIGVQGAWGAVVAVYLAIAAVSLRPVRGGA